MLNQFIIVGRIVKDLEKESNVITIAIPRQYKNENAEKAGVKQIRIHDFRHSCGSLLINNGANVTIVAKYLGHAKIDETLNTYSHIFDNKMDEVVDTINKLNQTNGKS